MKMEQNSFENQIKEKLENRSITPSNQVWSKLNEMLPVSEEPKRNYKWMFLAASCIGFISTAIFFQRQPDELVENDLPKITIENNMVPKTENTSNISNNLGIILDKKNPEKEIVKVESKINQKKNDEVIISENNGVKNNSNLNLEDVILNGTQKLIVFKEQTQNSSQLIAHESNSLNEIAQKNELDTKSNQIRVNVNSLLSQVENELNLTFRQKVIIKIAKNYKATKEILVARNQE
jgi:lipopolysaccharide export LptBFGC system permease protein LptF